jgi:hypothetical protein
MMGRRGFLFLFSLLFPLVALNGVAHSRMIPFETIAQGEISYYHYGDPNFSGAEMVIQDQKTWTWFWKNHVQGFIPFPQVPKINFNREMILLVMLGHQTTGGGPGIEIKLIQEIDTYKSDKDEMIRQIGVPKGIRVFVEENKTPGLLDVITNPYHIIKVKKFPTILFIRQLFNEFCNDSSQCEEGKYCEKKIGDCGGKGVCKLRPTVCLHVYDPVCGCDGVSYGNECVAASAGVSILNESPCEQGSPFSTK